MAKDKDKNTSLALGEQPASAPAVAATSLAAVAPEGAELSQYIDEQDFGDDGLSEIDGSDIKLPAKVFNMKGMDPKGEPIPINVFFDTVTEQTSKTLKLQLIKLHKTNEWSEFDKVEQKNKKRCRSFDRVTGTMEDGTERPCDGCPDAKWTTIEGKRSRRCGPVYNVFAVEVESKQPCVIRFKRTSLPVIQSYLNKYHIGRRVRGNSRSNWPLFSFMCEASLKIEKGSGTTTWAVPVLEKSNTPLDKGMIDMGAGTVGYVNDVLLGQLGKVSDADVSADADVDTSFNTADFAGGEGKDFIDSPSDGASAG